jgi:hypothetical protein
MVIHQSFIGKSEHPLARYCKLVVDDKVTVWVWVTASGRYDGYDIEK